MAGKYKHLRGKLETFQQPEAFQKKVDDEKREIIGASESVDASRSYLASLFADHYKKKKEHERAIKALNVKLTALSQLLTDKLQSEAEELVQLSSGGTVYLKDSIYPSVKDKDAFMKWVAREHLAAALAMPFKTLQSICIELSEKGKKIPPGISVYLKTEAQVRGVSSAADDEDDSE